MKLKDIAAHVGCPCTGDGDVDIQRVRSVESAEPGDLTFIISRKFIKHLETSRASAFIIPEKFPDTEHPSIRSPNPYYTFARVQEMFYRQPLPEGPFIHPTAVIAEDVAMGENCHIGAHVVIDPGVTLGRNVRILANSTIYTGAVIGDNVLIHSNCVVREYCELGNNVILQNGAVIGADGFGFAKTDTGEYYKILQAGRVILAEGVEVQANTCVDRGTLDDTIVGKGTKLDNLVQIAHGCEIGENTVMAAQVGLAGSTQVGNSVMLGGQVGVAGHCIIGDNVVVTAQSGIPGDVEKNKIISGSPAVDNRLWLRMAAAQSRLPEWVNRIRELEKAVDELKQTHE